MAIGNLAVIKKYFEAQPHGRKVTMGEMKALTLEDKKEMAPECGKALGLSYGPDNKWS